MRWRKERRSKNIEDRRGMGGSSDGYGRRLSGRFDRRRVSRGGIGAIYNMFGLKGLIIAGVVAMLLGFNPLELAGLVSSPSGTQSSRGFDYDESLSNSQGTLNTTKEEEELKEFISVALATTEEIWAKVLPQDINQAYKEPTLVLFRGATRSACGLGQAAMGPFYCPGDQKIYIDLSFFQELKTRFKAPGDFAQAYVLAHEVGHHIQMLTGILSEVQKRKSVLDRAGGNKLQVQVELQADCLAGVWAYHIDKRGLLEHGDIGEALSAAAAVGDDRIQKQTTGVVVPDSFTHGSSAQRKEAFDRGYKNGEMSACGFST